MYEIFRCRRRLSDGVVTAVLIAVLAAVSLPCSVCSQAGVGGVITAEPLFTAGTSNTIDFDTAAISGADVYEVCFFDDAVPGVHACIPSGSSKSLGGATLTSVVFEDLDDGHTYSYYVQAHFISADSIVFSDTTSSTQDASPPQIVSDATAQTEPGGIAVVDWTGVADAISSLGQYHILRKLAGQSYDVVDSVTPGATGTPHTYRDSLGGGTGLIEGEAQLYRVRAVDIVGNGINGNEAGPVAPDSTLPDTVVLTPEGAYYDGDTAYLAGVRTKVTARSNGSGPARADSIRFEWVRDSVEYFDSHWQPGWDYDSSGWMPYEPDSFYWDTSLLPPNGDTDYVHNHYYLFRAQAKDTSGNITGWSDTIGAYMDAYPPSDIANLTVGPKPDPVGVACVMLVEWDAATDAGSGVGRYYIHRKVGSGPGGQFEPIGSVDGGVTLYEDSCCGLNERDTLTYRIWSCDNAGNLRSSTVWEAGGWPPMPPIISASCDLTVNGLCFVQLKTIVTWLGYKTTNVTGYRVDVNGATHDIADPAQLVDTIPLSSDTVWTIKVRSFFNDGNVSIWSAAQHVRRDHSAPNPVDAFEVVADESYTGNIFLSWSKPWDSAAASDVVRYNIYRKKPADADYEFIDFTLTNDNDNYPNDGTIYTDLYADPGDDTLIAFQWYLYQSQPIDMLGNERHNPEPVDSAYCTRPPTIDYKEKGLDSIYIHWQRASPNLATEWYDSVRIYRDSYDNLVEIKAVYGNPDPIDCTYFPATLDSANYIFQVKEMPLDPQLVGMSSSWSAPTVVPFNNRPPPPESLFVIPQPTPDGGDPSIHISWYYEDTALVDSFTVVRSADGLDEVIFSVARAGGHYDSIMDSPVQEDVVYEYGVCAHDSLGQTSDTIWGAGSVFPTWRYTPNLEPLVPVYFDSDTLTLTWRWLDNTQAPVSNIYGAESCMVQVSIDSEFNDVLPHVDGEWAHADVGSVNIEGIRALADLLNSSEKRLYCRVKGMDRWGHMSPWSTDYWSPTLALLDDRPPSRCSTLVIDSTRADGSSSARAVDVYLSWSESSDRGGAGMKSYNVYRMNPDASTMLLHTLDYAVTEYLDDSVDVGNVANCDYSYWVQPVDSVGNEQTIGNNIVCLDVLTAPRIDSVTSTKICWTNLDPVANDSYYAEIALDSTWLGTSLIDSLGHADSISGDLTCWTFETNFDAGATVYYHIKLIRDELESNWSDVASFAPLPVDVDDDDEGSLRPITFALHPNYPNPFNPETQIAFDLPRRSQVLLRVFNIKGELVRTLHNSVLGSGSHVVVWDGRDRRGKPVASGVYVYQLKADDGLMSRKMVLLR